MATSVTIELVNSCVVSTIVLLVSPKVLQRRVNTVLNSYRVFSKVPQRAVRSSVVSCIFGSSVAAKSVMAV